MPAFRDEHILIIAPGSHTTLAQLGLPESFTPASHRFKTRMFPAPRKGEWEPAKIRKRYDNSGRDKSGRFLSKAEREELAQAAAAGEEDDDAEYEEDLQSDEGSVWPMRQGRIVNWPCFFALVEHVYKTLNPPFHTPILLIAQPVWTAKELERLTQFFFERFKTPGFAIIDAAAASLYAYGLKDACIIDVGLEKADVTALYDYAVDDLARNPAIPDCGGEAMTQRLSELLQPHKFTRDMCEQLKKSPICEILPAGTPMPRTGEPRSPVETTASAQAATSLPEPTSPKQAVTTSAGDGEQLKEDVEDNEGVLDVATIVTSNKMNDILAKKEQEKQARAAAKDSKKKGAAGTEPKQVKLKNSEKEWNTFMYDDFPMYEEMKKKAKAQRAEFNDLSTDANGNSNGDEAHNGVSVESSVIKADSYLNGAGSAPALHPPIQALPITVPRREVSVDTARFHPISPSHLFTLTTAIYNTIQSVPSQHRADIWDHLVILGNGAAVRGFKDAIVECLQNRYLISPSSATIFTSELPSNFSVTPAATTGANTPIPVPHSQQSHGHFQQSHSSNVNSLLVAATTASAQQQQQQQQQQASQFLHPDSAQIPPQHPSQQHHLLGTNPSTPQRHPSQGDYTPAQQQPSTPVQTQQRTSHSQQPMSIKPAKMPEYFPEWKDVGHEEAAFLGAQVAAKVVFVTDAAGQGSQGKPSYMTRTDYNEQGPTGISEYKI